MQNSKQQESNGMSIRKMLKKAFLYASLYTEGRFINNGRCNAI